MKCLFIGGIADGEWHEFSSYLMLPDTWTFTRAPQLPRLDLINELAGYTIHHDYTRRVWRCDDIEWSIYVLEGINDVTAFTQLLNGYGKGTK